MTVSYTHLDVYKRQEYISAVASRMKHAMVSVLHVPGIGTLDELRMAADCGAGCVHVASHCTEADVTCLLYTSRCV